MTNVKLNSCIALGAAVLFAAACSTTGDSTFSPTGPAFERTVGAQTAVICKTGPAGTYSFTAVAGDNANTSDVLVPTFDLVVATDGGEACTTVFTRTVSDDDACGNPGEVCDTPASILVTESAHTGTTLTNITAGPGAAPAVVNLPGSQVTVYVNAFHGATATFTNTADQAGCSYTQGWYKNPKHVWPAGSLQRGTSFDGGASAIDILNTPPKGNVYYILAHQYITALLNVQGGASSADITQALADAAAYFAAASVGNPLPAGYTKESVTAIASALDAYNNGITGPGHCDDEVVLAN